MLENIRELRPTSEIISGKFPRAKISQFNDAITFTMLLVDSHNDVFEFVKVMYKTLLVSFS